MALNLPELSLKKTLDAELKSVSYYGLSRHDVKLLLNDDLRRITSLEDPFVKDCRDSSGYLREDSLQSRGFNTLLAFAISVGERTYNNGYIVIKDVNTKLQSQKPVLFNIQSISLQGDQIIITSDEKSKNSKANVRFVGKKDNFLTDGLKALGFYTDEKPLLNSLNGLNASSITMGSYNLQQHSNGETVMINDTNTKDADQKTIGGVGFDILIAGSNVLVNFKAGVLQFLKLKTESKQIVADPYDHNGMGSEIKYGQYGSLLQAKLDPYKKNFMVGIFLAGGQKTLKIIRLDTKATLMASFDDMDEFVGFDGDDIVVYDNKGNLRNIDCNFNDFALHSKEDIAGSSDISFDSKTVTGGCKTFQEMFVSKDYNRALGYLLGLGGMVNQGQIQSILSRIQNNELISSAEKEQLLYVASPMNTILKTNTGRYLNELTVVSAPGTKREPLQGLLWDDQDKPNLGPILSDYQKFVKQYPHVLDCDSIEYKGKGMVVYTKGKFVGLKCKDAAGMYQEILACSYDSVEVTGVQQDLFKIEFVKGGHRGKMDYTLGKGVSNKIIVADKYQEVSEFDANNIGFAKDKSTGRYGFLSLSGDTMKEVGGFKYQSIKKIVDGCFGVQIDGASRVCFSSSKGEILTSRTSFTSSFAHAQSDFSFVKAGTKGIVVRDANSGVVGIMAFTKDALQESVEKLSLSSEYKLLGGTKINTFEYFAKTGELILKDANGKYIVKSILPNGSIANSQPLFGFEVLDPQHGSIAYVDENKTSIIINKRPSLNGQGLLKSSTFMGTKKIGEKLYYIFADKEQKIQLITYDPKDGIRSLNDQEGRNVLVTTPDLGDTIITLDTSLGLRYVLAPAGGKGSLLQLAYNKIGDVVTYKNDLELRWFKKGDKFGILIKKGGKISELHPAISTTIPQFAAESYSLGGMTYNLNSKADFVKLEHNFDELEAAGIAGVKDVYIVRKGKKYGFATMNDGVVKSLGALQYDSKPDLVKKDDNNYYMLTQSSNGYQISVFSILGFTNMKASYSSLAYENKPEYCGKGLFVISQGDKFYPILDNGGGFDILLECSVKPNVKNGTFGFIGLEGSTGKQFIKLEQMDNNKDLPNVMVQSSNTLPGMLLSIEAVYKVGGLCFLQGVSINGKPGLYIVFEDSIYTLFEASNGMSSMRSLTEKNSKTLYDTNKEGFVCGGFEIQGRYDDNPLVTYIFYNRSENNERVEFFITDSKSKTPFRAKDFEQKDGIVSFKGGGLRLAIFERELKDYVVELRIQGPKNFLDKK